MSMAFQEMGAVKNHFQILTKDAKGFAPKQLSMLSPLSTTHLAEQLGKSRPNMYVDKISFKSLPVDLIEGIHKIVVISDLAYELFKDEEKTIGWMISPNNFLFGLTPFQACLVGRGDDLIKLLAEKLGMI